MERALLAVGGLLMLCLLVIGGLVYLERSEDRVAVDAVLAEDFSRAVTLADGGSDPVAVDALTGFAWDRMLLVAEGTPREAISHALGSEFKGDLLYTAESKDTLVFARGSGLAAFADYRGPGRFDGVVRPIAQFTPATAVFRVRGMVITPEPGGRVGP